MKRFSLVLSVWLATLVLPGRAQDAAVLEERVKRLSGYVQDLQEKSDSQQKQIEALGKDLAALREHQASQPTAASASQEDLRDLAKKVQEIEEKRKADRVFLEKEFARLAKLANAKPTASRAEPAGRSGDTSPDLPKDALEHTIASGDTISTIAAAYSKETGKKITTDMILRANPGLKPERLVVKTKILIPVPDK
jgi:phage tail protein X/outer membrane murein-binding lipoprotein Lpp